MNEPLPPHQNNPETIAIEEFQQFVADYVPPPPGTKGTPRPIGRERWRTVLGVPPLQITLPPIGSLGEPTIGAVIVLRSGSPPMTVLGLPTPGEVQCGWFHEDNYHQANFPRAAVLVVAQPEAQPAA